MLGSFYITAFCIVLIVLGVFVRILVRGAVGIGSGKDRSFSSITWGSRILAAITLTPPIILAFAMFAAEVYDDQLVRKLAAAAVVMSFVGIAAVIASVVLLSCPESRHELVGRPRTNLLLVNAMGLVSAVVVIRVFWHLLVGY